MQPKAAQRSPDVSTFRNMAACRFGTRAGGWVSDGRTRNLIQRRWLSGDVSRYVNASDVTMSCAGGAGVGTTPGEEALR